MSLNAFDIIGPIMIGPSSSHTAGAVRLGQMGRIILDQEPKHVSVFLHGSFAETFEGHGTNLALVAGLLGLATDDERIPKAFELAQQAGLTVDFIPTDLGDVHPNTARLELVGKADRTVAVTGSSVGGGSILITKIDDFPVELSGAYNSLIVVHRDKPGVVAQITTLLAAAQVNIAQMRLSRQKKGSIALAVIETDQQADNYILDLIRRLPAVSSCMAAKPLT
ncbi:MAG TPA: L-serine ammonia-lyase, iron-sulfur-dependent subunit beta [Candidatus Deferrimicrobium sp.]|nr:L-serine ammonia-lyase, iron-sulfur-dependent subunit beta [Candidatus Deferrimicrobium sp.]